MRIVCFVLLLSILFSCVDPFTKKYEFNTNLVRIEGLLTDQNPFSVIISQSRSVQQTQFEQPIKGATVELLVGDGSRVALRESGLTPGTYEAPTTFRGKVGQAYRLRARFTDNKVYESSLEKLGAAVDIAKTHVDFNQNGLKEAGGFVLASTMDVSVDVQDDSQTQNYYQWRSYLTEFQRICASCVNGDWNPVTLTCNGYRLDPPPMPPFTNDYECAGQCWEIYLDERLNIFSDVLTNGKPITKRLIRQVPYYLENRGALVEIHQLSITPTMFRYFDLIRKQSETTGTLTDVAPAPPVGNIRNINNAEEPVVGYFAAAGISKITLWIDRNVTGAKSTTMLGGRQPILDSGDPFTRLPKFYRVPCISSRNRTPIQPVGWRF